MSSDVKPVFLFLRRLYFRCLPVKKKIPTTHSPNNHTWGMVSLTEDNLYSPGSHPSLFPSYTLSQYNQSDLIVDVFCEHVLNLPLGVNSPSMLSLYLSKKYSPSSYEKKYAPWAYNFAWTLVVNPRVIPLEWTCPLDCQQVHRVLTRSHDNTRLHVIRGGWIDNPLIPTRNTQARSKGKDSYRGLFIRIEV